MNILEDIIIDIINILEIYDNGFILYNKLNDYNKKSFINPSNGIIEVIECSKRFIYHFFK